MNLILRLMWKLGFVKPSIERIRENVRKDNSLVYDGYCAVCNDDDFFTAPFSKPNIFGEKRSGQNCDWMGKCRVCGTEYLEREIGISDEDESECDEKEKYVFFDGQRILLGQSKNFNRENMSHQVLI